MFYNAHQRTETAKLLLIFSRLCQAVRKDVDDVDRQSRLFFLQKKMLWCHTIHCASYCCATLKLSPQMWDTYSTYSVST